MACQASFCITCFIRPGFATPDLRQRLIRRAVLTIHVTYSESLIFVGKLMALFSRVLLAVSLPCRCIRDLQYSTVFSIRTCSVSLIHCWLAEDWREIGTAFASDLCADDTPISCRPTDADQSRSRVSACIDEVTSWMEANRLQLNTAKTKVI